MPQYNYRMHSDESLANIEKELDRLRLSIQVERQSLKEDGITQIEVRNNSIMVKALDSLAKFSYALREAHLKAREGRGAYDAEQKRPAKTRKRK